MLNSIIKISVPASTSNLGPGLDTIGLALGLNNVFTFRLIDDSLEPKVSIEGYGAYQIDKGSRNLAYQGFYSVFNALGVNVPGVQIHQNNLIPIARGLGGSSTAILAGIIAAYTFLEIEPRTDDVLTYSLMCDPFIDNAIASLIGGLVVSTTKANKIVYLKVPIPNEISCVIYIPNFEIKTGESRKVLPKQVSFDDAVSNVRSTALLVAALMSGTKELLRYAMSDCLHQPYRASLIPGLYKIFDAAIEAGAHGVCLSGAGSGILALVDEECQGIADALEEAGKLYGLNGYSLHLPIQQDGAQVQIL